MTDAQAHANKTLNSINDMIETLNLQLSELEEGLEDKPNHWGYVGTLESIKAQLANIVNAN